MHLSQIPLRLQLHMQVLFIWGFHIFEDFVWGMGDVCNWVSWMCFLYFSYILYLQCSWILVALFIVDDKVIPSLLLVALILYLLLIIIFFGVVRNSSMSLKWRGQTSGKTCLRSCPHSWTTISRIACSCQTSFAHSPLLISVEECGI